MTELTKERVEELRKYIEDAFGEWGQDRPIVARVKADLLAILSSYSALKVENERLNSHLKAATDSKNRAIHRWHTEWTRAEKAEAELVDEQKRRAAIAESLQAHQDELAKQAPLIEAVMRAILYDSEVPGSSALEFSETDEKAIYRAAL